MDRSLKVRLVPEEVAEQGCIQGGRVPDLRPLLLHSGGRERQGDPAIQGLWVCHL